MVLLSAGSGDLLRAAVQAFTSPARGLVLPHPTFEMPANAAARLGHPVTPVPVDAELRMDLDALGAAARGAGLLYLCNPNNPTSTTVPGDAVAAVIAALAAASPHTAVLVDEAYDDYAADPAYHSVIDLVRSQPRLVVVRTFSKIHGMAGLRVGYAIGQPDLLEPLRAGLPAMALNVLGVAAATASLADVAHLGRQVALNAETRARTAGLFERLGYRVARSGTNFIMVDVRRPCAEFRARCAAERVFVGRAFPPLDTWSRITIGTAEEMTRALDVFSRALRPASA
jgi:histidinol-phosphate aminotransferase